MSKVKWTLILMYWLWLDYRNIHACQSHDWRLWIQITINTLVILSLVLEKTKKEFKGEKENGKEEDRSNRD